LRLSSDFRSARSRIGPRVASAHRSANRKSLARFSGGGGGGEGGEGGSLYATGLGEYGRYSHYSRVRRGFQPRCPYDRSIILRARCRATQLNFVAQPRHPRQDEDTQEINYVCSFPCAGVRIHLAPSGFTKFNFPLASIPTLATFIAPSCDAPDTPFAFGLPACSAFIADFLLSSHLPDLSRILVENID